jgi:hypothetical protein
MSEIWLSASTASAGGEETIGITHIPIRVNGGFEEEILFVHVTVDCGKLQVVCGSEGCLNVEENVQRYEAICFLRTDEESRWRTWVLSGIGVLRRCWSLRKLVC